MMLYTEVCFPLLQALAQTASQCVSNATTVHATVATYLSDTATKPPPLLRIYVCGIC